MWPEGFDPEDIRAASNHFLIRNLAICGPLALTILVSNVWFFGHRRRGVLMRHFIQQLPPSITAARTTVTSAFIHPPGTKFNFLVSATLGIAGSQMFILGRWAIDWLGLYHFMAFYLSAAATSSFAGRVSWSGSDQDLLFTLKWPASMRSSSKTSSCSSGSLRSCWT